MSLSKLSDTRKARVFPTALFFFGLAIVAFTHTWWPGILLVVAAAGGLRKYLQKQYFGMAIVVIVCVGIFSLSILNKMSISEQESFLVPLLFVLAGLYILARALLSPKEEAEAEEEGDEEV